MAVFIAFAAVPYMAQRVTLEIINTNASQALANSVENAFRLEMAPNALAALKESPLTVQAHSDALRGVVSTSFQIIERKLFALPKLALFPPLVARNPKVALMALPPTICLDMAKSWIGAALTSAHEALNEQVSSRFAAAIASLTHPSSFQSRDIASRRARIEAHDAQNAHLLAEAGAGARPFTSAQWRNLTVDLQATTRSATSVSQLRGWISWLHWSDILKPSIEIVLATWLDVGEILANEVFVYVLRTGAVLLLPLHYHYRTNRPTRLSGTRASSRTPWTCGSRGVASRPSSRRRPRTAPSSAT